MTDGHRLNTHSWTASEGLIYDKRNINVQITLYSVIRGIYCHCISLCYLFVIWDEREVYDSMTIDKFNDGWTSAEHTLLDRK